MSSRTIRVPEVEAEGGERAKARDLGLRDGGEKPGRLVGG
jgi:hypothetical protein